MQLVVVQVVMNFATQGVTSVAIMGVVFFVPVNATVVVLWFVPVSA